MKWIFGYGSLIWRPGIPFVQKRKAIGRGWSRRFWQLSPDHRGTVARPGRVVTLVPDKLCDCVGMAFGIGDKNWDEVITNLDDREKNGYERHLVKLSFEDSVQGAALTYVAGPGNPSYSPFVSADGAVAQQVLEAVGPSGTNLDYLIRLNQSLVDMDTHDPEVSSLLDAVLKLQAVT